MIPAADLDRALRREAELIGEVRAALAAQRAAVAADDIERVELSVQAVGRTLLVLDEARRRRAAIATLASGREVGSLAELEAAWDGPMPLSLREACAAVRREAEAAASEARVNQAVLRGALDAADAYLQHLFTAADPTPVYQPATRRTEPVARLVDRTA
ncbi:MAG: hypothetical protein NW201_00330 [Gemmatimonadales bacterium]|nr:hypothetical protein [Gemmatimonadales bacterium]